MTELVVERPRTRVLRSVLEAAVVVVFALLIWNNYTLRRQQVRAAAAPSVQRGFVPKDWIGTVPVTDLAGNARLLDLHRGRNIVAIVDPRCESCREIIATLRGATDVRVLSVAPLAETRAAAETAGIAAITTVARAPLPRPIERQLRMYPQIFVVERGEVVRTCKTIAECR
ncbi:MAG TPA: hypothetical protein VHK90_15735 [Thermoanaerobaculia bacterium]|nr:hypothetical protein [Thermoanaerobaculia bacterium]